MKTTTAIYEQRCNLFRRLMRLMIRDAAKGKSRKKPISLRMDHDLLELTKEVARQHTLPYQVVIRLWIEEGLCRAIREGVDNPDWQLEIRKPKE